jgi:flagellar protein FliT
MASKNPLVFYQKIAATTSQMLAAAQEQDWDLLTELEQNCSGYVEELKKLETVFPTNSTMSNQKIEYIKRILEDDKEIRSLVSPWMQKLNSLMNCNHVEQKLIQTYRQ